MADTDRTRKKGGMAYRGVTAVFGVLFTIVAIAIVVVSEFTIGAILAAVVIGILGINAMIGAYRNTPTLLSRIGPLP